jgi:hypothetical protein
MLNVNARITFSEFFCQLFKITTHKIAIEGIFAFICSYANKTSFLLKLFDSFIYYAPQALKCKNGAGKELYCLSKRINQLALDLVQAFRGPYV